MDPYQQLTPVMFVDVSGYVSQPIQMILYNRSFPGGYTYNRDKAVGYSQIWYDDFNPMYPHDPNHDCANFVSQCLVDGGMPVTKEWKTYMGFTRELEYKLKGTSAWSSANEQYQYFSDPDNGYCDYVIVLSSSAQVKEIANSRYIQYGDTIYFSNGGAESIYHAAIITRVENGEIYYAAHSDPYAWKALGNEFFVQQEQNNPDNLNTVYIVHFF